MRVSYDTMYQEFVRVLLKRGFTKKKQSFPQNYMRMLAEMAYTHMD